MTDKATPDELRARGKEHLAKWRALLPDDPEGAREELHKASNLAMLAAEADDHAKRVAEAVGGE
jgi:hypothetical protein